MNPQTTAYLIAAICGVTCLGFWIWLVAVPVARSFDGTRDRTIAAALSLYTLMIGIMLGGGLGLLVAWQWDRITGVS